ncbi:acetyltransferase [bacterium]|nr:acetyltransferase [bacterium]MBU0900048.1 acetyltransferase [bacterium]MBU1153229.1 acetyltransferase [bacterium]MBU1782778.1 acetyltransferase [bacterium]MBU2599175.1 acetyltransferase [bacterium]
MAEKVIIMGAGGHGRVVIDILREGKQYEVVGFLDSNPNLQGRVVDGLSVLGDISLIPKLLKEGVRGGIIGIGDNNVRQGFFEDFKKEGLILINAIHPSAVVSRTVYVGCGVVISARAVVWTAAQIGDNSIINTGAIVEHENIIEENVHLASGVQLGGNVKVGRNAFIGAGSTVIPYIKIGKDAKVGAGSVVIEDIGEGITVAGVPARKI